MDLRGQIPQENDLAIACAGVVGQRDHRGLLHTFNRIRIEIRLSDGNAFLAVDCSLRLGLLEAILWRTVLPAMDVPSIAVAAVAILAIASNGELMAGQFVLHGLSASREDLLHPFMEFVDVTLQERCFELTLDVAACTEATVVRQTDLLRDTDVEYQGHFDPSLSVG
jgi:hypothetical protein